MDNITSPTYQTASHSLFIRQPQTDRLTTYVCTTTRGARHLFFEGRISIPSDSPGRVICPLKDQADRVYRKVSKHEYKKEHFWNRTCQITSLMKLMQAHYLGFQKLGPKKQKGGYKYVSS